MTRVTNLALAQALDEVGAPLSRVDVDLLRLPLGKTFDLFSAEAWLDLSARVEASVPALAARHPQLASCLAMRAANVVAFAATRQISLPAMNRAFLSLYELNRRIPEAPILVKPRNSFPPPPSLLGLGRPRKIAGADVERLFSAGCDYFDVARALDVSVSAIRKVASASGLKPLSRKERTAVHHALGFTGWLRTEWQEGRILEAEAWRMLSQRGEPDRTGGLLAELDRQDSREPTAEAATSGSRRERCPA